VEPTSGVYGDKVTILATYDGDYRKVIHVLFHERQEAEFEVINNDQNLHLTIRATVPDHAETGGIEIDLEGVDTPLTGANFTVDSPSHPLRITGLNPAAGPYKRGSPITFLLNAKEMTNHDDVQVFFPTTTDGAPIKQVRPPPIFQFPSGIKVRKVPEDAQTGRVKVVWKHLSVLSNRLTIGD
jgi:hypothetical protein